MSNTLDDFDQLCASYVGSKLTQIVLCKNIIPIFNKLEKVNADLWGLHYLPSLFDKIYSVILMYKFF